MWICASCGHVNDNDLWPACEHCGQDDDYERMQARVNAAKAKTDETEFKHKPSGRFSSRH